MRNQTSFRLTTTLLPSDTTAKTTTVINKVDANGNKFYPTFTEETVVITNDDRTVMETTRAVCTDWVLTFVKRGLSDDNSETPVDNRKLTWNPWSLCFITAGAGDWIDKDDDITWTWDQTYTGDLVSTGSATYRGALITEKWVKYPHFDNVAALEAYSDPFGWMFAVVDSTWELYRYNAVTEEWSVVESSTPTNPEMASTTTIWTVRVATDAEFTAWTATGGSGEKLMATVTQIKNNTPVVDIPIPVFTVSWTDDLTNAQLVLNSVLSWHYPMVMYKKRNDDIYRAYYFTVNNPSWVIIFLDIEKPSTTQHWVKLYYSWTTATELVEI